MIDMDYFGIIVLLVDNCLNLLNSVFSLYAFCSRNSEKVLQMSLLYNPIDKALWLDREL